MINNRKFNRIDKRDIFEYNMEIKCQCLTIIVLLIMTIIQHSNAIDISNEILEVEKEIDEKFGDFFKNKR